MSDDLIFMGTPFDEGGFYSKIIAPLFKAECLRRSERNTAHIQDLLACGYRLDELVQVCFRDGRPDEVMPKSMLEG